MDMLARLRARETCLAVVGLGYVGLPLAEAFSHHFRVIGYDCNEAKIKSYREGHDPTNELGDAILARAEIEFTAAAEALSEASFIIISVPTPIHGDNTPNLAPLKGATRTVAQQLRRGSTVVYESTVYPGLTEEVCLPLLEEGSGLKAGRDFRLGYSPERINPGDAEHRLHNIVKVVSGLDEETLAEVKAVYDTVIDETYPAPSIKVAEAAKLVENAQRDINIAFMNELAMVFHRMGIDTGEVVKAMDTKWNALHFRPGLVGGHCIGIDPYYFIYQAESLGYHSQIISSGRHVNDGMSSFVAGEVVKAMIKARVDVSRARVYLLGMTFKEDCPDTRNSRPVDVYRCLREYGLQLMAADPVADAEAFRREYGFSLTPVEEVREADCLVVLVGHACFRKLTAAQLAEMYRAVPGRPRVLADVKGIYAREEMEQAGFAYWSL